MRPVPPPEAAIAAPGGGRLLWRYVRPGSAAFSGMLLLTLAANGAALIQPLIAQQVLDALEEGNSVLRPVLLMAGTAVASVVLTGVSRYAFGRFGQRMVLTIRRGLADRLLRAPVGAIESRPIGDLLSRSGSDTTLLQHALSHALVDSVASPLALIAACVLMGFIDLTLLLVIAGLLLVAGVIEWFVLNRLYLATEQEQAQVGQFTTVLHRALVAFRTVKAFGTEDHELGLINTRTVGAYRAGMHAARLDAIVEVIAVASIELIFLLVLAVGTVRVTSGALDIAGLVAFLLYVIYLREPIESFSEGVATLAEGLAALKRVEQVKGLPSETDTSTGAATPRHTSVTATSIPTMTTRAPRPSLVVDNVVFGYGDSPVLRGVSFTASQGLTVLAGESGTGKTTILSLIERFHDISAGVITLDGINLRDYSRHHLRRRIAYVQQEASLLGDTVGAALCYGRIIHPDPDEITAVLNAVALDRWVASLPDGLNTPVGERGVTMSGGQRQRLAIARSLLRGANILLLDEATSQLDGRSERHILTTIRTQAQVRTVIAVTHRLSTAKEADQVVLLENGIVRATGRHEELLSTDQHYLDLALSG